jgi:hypothetical protein
MSASHPIVVMLPLIGLLNFKLEKRSWEGIGLQVVQPMQSVVRAIIFALLSAAGWMIALRFDSLSLTIPALNAGLVG